MGNHISYEKSILIIIGTLNHPSSSYIGKDVAYLKLQYIHTQSPKQCFLFKRISIYTLYLPSSIYITAYYFLFRYTVYINTLNHPSSLNVIDLILRVFE